MLIAPWSSFIVPINLWHSGENFLLNTCIVDRHMTVVHRKVKHDSQPRWMNDEIRTAIKTRDFHIKENTFCAVQGMEE